MIKRSSLFLFISVSLLAKAQTNSSIDSLQLFVKNTKDENAIAGALLALGKAYFVIDFDKSMAFFDEALAIGKKQNAAKTLASAYNGKGILYINLGQHTKAIEYLDSAAIYHKLGGNEKGIASVYGNLGSLYFSIGEYKKSLEFQLKSLAIEEAINDEIGQAITLEGVAGIYFVQNEFEKALHWYEKALALNKKLHGSADQFSSILNIGLTYQSLKKYKEANLFLNQAIGIADTTHNDDGLANGYFGLGLVARETNDLKKALTYFQKALTLFDKVGNVYRGLDVYNSIAEIYFIKKEYQKSIEYNNLFLQKAKQAGMKQYERSALEDLAKNYAALKNYEKAYHYQSQLSDLKDSIWNDEKIGQMAEMQTKFETEKKESENQLLKQQNQIQLLEIKRNNILIVGFFGTLLLVLIIGMLVFRQSKINAKQRTIELEQKLLRSQMNPHFIFNSLIAIQSFIYNSEPKEAGKYLADFAKLIRMILENSRQEYISLAKEISTLEYYLKLQQLRFDDKFTYTIEVADGLDVDVTAIPPMLAQPLIKNAIEHGIKHLEQQGVIKIKFSMRNNHLLFEVNDNGIGIAKSNEIKQEQETHKSIATAIIKERLVLLNKRKQNKITLVVDELKDTLHNALGTTVFFTIPYQEV